MLNRCMTSNRAVVLVSLALSSVRSYAQTLSIISIPPIPVLPSFSSETFTPNGPSSSYDSLGTGTPPSTGLAEPTFPPTMTSCFIPPTGTVRSRLTLDPSAPTQPAYAECIEIIHTSDHIIEIELFTVASDGQTLLPTAEPSSSPFASASSHSGIGTGAVVGAVVGAVFGSLLIGATLFWIRRQRRSARPVGTWINRPAGWVRDEKPRENIIEMSHRDGI